MNGEGRRASGSRIELVESTLAPRGVRWPRRRTSNALTGAPTAVADNHSFDIVSEINTAEMHNAVVQAQHEIAVRYDFKGTKAGIEYNKKDNQITLTADDKGQLDTVVQMLKEKMAKRSVAVNALQRGKMEEATHDSVREVATLHVGIETDD